VKNSYGKRVK